MACIYPFKHHFPFRECLLTGPETVEGVATFNMRQKDFGPGRTRARLRNARLFFLLTTILDYDVPLVATLRAVERHARARKNLGLLQLRSLSISGASFNLNAYDDATALRHFRFRVHEIGRYMVDFMGWGPRVRTWNSG
jgi:hypothetical protein